VFNILLLSTVTELESELYTSEGSFWSSGRQAPLPSDQKDPLTAINTLLCYSEATWKLELPAFSGSAIGAVFH
jgi:hypothetical protein